MTEIATRALTGAAYVALTVGAALAGPLTTTLLFLPVCLLAAREMQRLADRDAARPAPRAMPLLIVAAAYLAVAASGAGLLSPPGVAAVLLTAFTAGVAEVLVDHGPRPLGQTGLLLVLIAYVALPFGLITSLLPNGPHLFIGFLVLLWTNDTGAYLVGRAIGRTKLMPQVSPKKTVEGLVGGVALAMVAGAVLAQAWPELGRGQWIACGAVVGVASTIGDLLESAFKREAGVKDSGSLLPGHGGILDRFDGFLLALPAMLVFVKLIGG